MLDSTIRGAVAAGRFPDVPSVMRAMSAAETSFEPADGATRDLHARRFDAFQRLQSVARDVARQEA